MSEYRKPYEYEEEKGTAGLVLVFFIMLLTLELLLAAATMVQGSRVLKDTPSLNTAVLAAGSASLLLVFAACIALRKRFPHGVTLSRIQLVVRVPLLVPVQILLFVSLSTTVSGPAEPPSPVGILVTRLIAPVGYILVFSGAWYAYFPGSKKVRQLLAAQRKEV